METIQDQHRNLHYYLFGQPSLRSSASLPVCKLSRGMMSYMSSAILHVLTVVHPPSQHNTATSLPTVIVPSTFPPANAMAEFKDLSSFTMRQAPEFPHLDKRHIHVITGQLRAYPSSHIPLYLDILVLLRSRSPSPIQCTARNSIVNRTKMWDVYIAACYLHEVDHLTH